MGRLPKSKKAHGTCSSILDWSSSLQFPGPWHPSFLLYSDGPDESSASSPVQVKVELTRYCIITLRAPCLRLDPPPASLSSSHHRSRVALVFRPTRGRLPARNWPALPDSQQYMVSPVLISANGLPSPNTIVHSHIFFAALPVSRVSASAFLLRITPLALDISSFLAGDIWEDLGLVVVGLRRCSASRWPFLSVKAHSPPPPVGFQ
jgi:hypothetical protein